MREDGNTRGTRRYIALDIHKKYCVIGGVDREGRVVLHAVRVEHADREGWLKKNLLPTDHVVFESTTNAWHVYDLLAPLVGSNLYSATITRKLPENRPLQIGDRVEIDRAAQVEAVEIRF